MGRNRVVLLIGTSMTAYAVSLAAVLWRTR